MSNGNRPDPRPDPRDKVVRERKRRGGAASEFDFDRSKVPAGSVYEWKRATVLGKVDVTHAMTCADQGWLPVDVSKHPEFMPPGTTGPIVRGDMMLMERPVELQKEAHEEEITRARRQVGLAEAQLDETKKGTFEREARVSRSVEPHRAIPD